MGGFDHLDISSLAVAATAGLGFSLDVVLSKGAPHLARLQEAARSDIVVHVSTPNMVSLIENADISIGAGGGTAWERCCLGLPTLIIVTADNQRENARRLDLLGAAQYLGNAPNVTKADLAYAVCALAEDPARLRDMAHKSAALCDGEGCNRIVAALGEVE